MSLEDETSSVECYRALALLPCCLTQKVEGVWYGRHDQSETAQQGQSPVDPKVGVHRY